MPKAGKTQGNQSGEKLLTLLETLVLSDGPVRLMDISEELGISHSTIKNFLQIIRKKLKLSSSKDIAKIIIATL